MKITRKSMLTGKEGTMDLDVTEEQVRQWQEGDEVIQVVFPNLKAEEREFLLTGILPDEWKATFGEEEELDLEPEEESL